MPIVGGIVSGAAIIVGLGALVIMFMSRSREQRRPVLSATVTAPIAPAPVPA